MQQKKGHRKSAPQFVQARSDRSVEGLAALLPVAGDEFVGLQGTGHKPLPPEELIQRWVMVLRAAQRQREGERRADAGRARDESCLAGTR